MCVCGWKTTSHLTVILDSNTAFVYPDKKSLLTVLPVHFTQALY